MFIFENVQACFVRVRRSIGVGTILLYVRNCIQVSPLSIVLVHHELNSFHHSSYFKKISTLSLSLLSQSHALPSKISKTSSAKNVIDNEDCIDNRAFDFSFFFCIFCFVFAIHGGILVPTRIFQTFFSILNGFGIDFGRIVARFFDDFLHFYANLRF